MLLMVVLASLFECMVRFKIANKSTNHLTTHDLMFAARCRVTALNACSAVPLPPYPLAMAMAAMEDVPPLPPSTLRRRHHPLGRSMGKTRLSIGARCRSAWQGEHSTTTPTLGGRYGLLDASHGDTG